MLTKTRTSFTEALGIRGWAHLESAFLAALATESPLLMIGSHGTGKSQLIEAVAAALNMPYRHYNASLLNYDDIMGIPMPNDDATAVNFIKSPGTIWGAGFVFLDEISRCRADLQNKLFPIVWEKRVLGMPLENLVHRWSAMNPPAPDDLDVAATAENVYFGSEPLDPALTDRFPFIVSVPTWAQLTADDRRQLVNWHASTPTPHALDLPAMVQAVAALIPELEATFQDWLSDYIVCLVDQLEQNGLLQSPRRARMLARNVVAVHAARIILEGEDIDIEHSAEMAVRFGLPQTATDTPPTIMKVVGIHKQAWELAHYLEDDAWRQVMEVHDPARRVALADELGFSDEDLSRLITHTLSVEESDTRQIGLALGMFLKFSRTRDLDPSAFEPLAQLSYHILEPRLFSYTLTPNAPEEPLWNELAAWINAQHSRAESPLFRLQRNLLLFGFPDLWGREDWRQALSQFTDDLKQFGITDQTDNL